MTRNRRRSHTGYGQKSRRDFLRLVLEGSVSLGLATAASGCSRSKSTSKAEGTDQENKPRYYVGLLMSGGHDTVYTTDPKERSEVLDDISLPEKKNEITAEGSLRFGTHFAPLAPMAKDLASLNGVQLGTANHDTGIMQFFRLKTNVSVNMPSVLDILGSHRDSQPLSSIYLNLLYRVSHTPKYIGTADRFYHGERNLLDEVAATSPDELRILGKVLQGKAASLRREGQRTSTSMTLDNLDQTAKFLLKVAEVEPMSKNQYSDNYMAQVMAEGFDQALWLIKNDLVCGVGVELGILEWDSHIANHNRQTLANTNFVKHFIRFMEGLATRSNKHGLLADNTVVFAGSDMGRFPRLNDMQGKDHLPQTSFLFAGPMFKTGVMHGHTGKEMETVPISFKTGRRMDIGGRKVLLDDIGSTLLSSAGLDPQLYGYHGNVLDFLLKEREV